MKIAADLFTQKFEKINENETVAEALRKMRSSNTKILVVFDEDKNYKGLVKEKDLILVRGNPELVKVSSFIYTPPRIKKSDEIHKIAKHMIESDSYVLPVFNQKGSFIGIIHIDSLLEEIVANEELKKVKVGEVMTKNPIVLNVNDSIAKAIKMMARNKISHLPIMENGKLVGIVSSHDIIEKVIKPRRRVEWGEVSGEKISSLSNPISSIMTYPAITLNKASSIKDAIEKMFKNNISCIVIGNAEGILTKRDLLELLVKPKETGIAVQVAGIHNLNEFEKADLNTEIKKFIEKIQRILNNGVLTIYIKKIKRKEGETCNVRARLFLPGKVFIATAEGYRIRDTIQLMFDKLEREIVDEFEKAREVTKEREFFEKTIKYLGEIKW